MIPDFERSATERLLLRALREDDAEALYSLHNDPSTAVFTPSSLMRSMDDARTQLALWLEGWARDGFGYWMVERKDAPGVVVGLSGVRIKDQDGLRVLNLAYRFAPSTWGSGYATEAARAAMALAARHLPHIPLIAVIHPENTASLRVAERLGMRFDRMTLSDGVPNRVYVVGTPA
jgi:RimJ/RimL family protein N-acetyltransferase